VAIVRYFAAAKAAAGCAQETVPAGTLDELVAALADRHGERMSLVLKASSYLIDGVCSRDLSTVVDPESTVDVLPPFAGG
jgi:molybdopterin converting factor small subunit